MKIFFSITERRGTKSPYMSGEEERIVLQTDL